MLLMNYELESTEYMFGGVNTTGIPAHPLDLLGEGDAISVNSDIVQCDNSGKTFYVVERILNKRRNKQGEIEYLIKWQGHNYHQVTWELWSDLIRSNYDTKVKIEETTPFQGLEFRVAHKDAFGNDLVERINLFNSRLKATRDAKIRSLRMRKTGFVERMVIPRFRYEGKGESYFEKMHQKGRWGDDWQLGGPLYDEITNFKPFKSPKKKNTIIDSAPFAIDRNQFLHVDDRRSDCSDDTRPTEDMASLMDMKDSSGQPNSDKGSRFDGSSNSSFVGYPGDTGRTAIKKKVEEPSVAIKRPKAQGLQNTQFKIGKGPAIHSKRSNHIFKSSGKEEVNSDDQRDDPRSVPQEAYAMKVPTSQNQRSNVSIENREKDEEISDWEHIDSDIVSLSSLDESSRGVFSASDSMKDEESSIVRKRVYQRVLKHEYMGGHRSITEADEDEEEEGQEVMLSKREKMPTASSLWASEMDDMSDSLDNKIFKSRKQIAKKSIPRKVLEESDDDTGFDDSRFRVELNRRMSKKTSFKPKVESIDKPKQANSSERESQKSPEPLIYRNQKVSTPKIKLAAKRSLSKKSVKSRGYDADQQDDTQKRSRRGPMITKIEPEVDDEDDSDEESTTIRGDIRSHRVNKIVSTIVKENVMYFEISWKSQNGVKPGKSLVEDSLFAQTYPHLVIEYMSRINKV